jgi:predicted transcriptional regulator
MHTPISDLLDDDLYCEALLEQTYGLNDLECDCFEVLGESDEPLTVSEVADRVDRGHSTTYRTLKRLCTVGVARKERVLLDGGGRSHVYDLVDPEVVADELGHRLDALYGELTEVADRFPEWCGDDSDAAAVGD